MKTIVESPQARLRRELGLGPIVSRSSRPRVDDYFPFDCGDQVCRTDDERHEGRVSAVVSGTVVVQWENKWREECDPRDLRKVQS